MVNAEELPIQLNGVERSTPDGPDRTAACLAMVSFWLCSVFGAVLVLWWGRRQRSAFAQRYALVSLVLEGLVLVAILAYMPIFLLAPQLVVNIFFLVFWFFEALIVIYALVLAVYAGIGRDVSTAPVPAALIRRLPRWQRA